MIAALPMYDWPEVQSATDQWWQCLQAEFDRAGFDAPKTLTRNVEPMQLWTSSELLLGQTCGYPYITKLKDKVNLLGTPDYGVPDCKPGFYRSAIVVRADDKRANLEQFRQTRFAFNSTQSQSGYRAMIQLLPDKLSIAEYFGRGVMSGSHRESIQFIVAGRADIAAIDYVSWRMAVKFETTAQQLRVLCLSEQYPGLPYICTCTVNRQKSIAVIENAMANVDRSVLKSLQLRGFWRSCMSDYTALAAR